MMGNVARHMKSICNVRKMKPGESNEGYLLNGMEGKIVSTRKLFESPLIYEIDYNI